MFENYYPLLPVVCRYAMIQKSILNEPKWGGAQAVVRGDGAPWPHRSDGTGYHYKE